MRSVFFVIGALVLLGIGAVGGILVYNAVIGGSGEPSEAISAPTLDPDITPTPGYDQIVATNEALRTAVAEAQAATPEATPEPEATDNATAESTPEAPVTTEEAAADESETNNAEADNSERTLFRIQQEDSQVSFEIDEVLRGNPTTVIGTTDQVAGDVVVDFGNPASSQIGTIRINMRTLSTDNQFRNQALRAQILESAQDQYEFANFEPTNLSGLPQEAVSIGDTLSFQVTGNLTIRDVTREVTFDTEVNVTAEDRLEGSASTTIRYPDFNITIPDVPNVSGVEEEVLLSIDFVATTVDEGSEA